MVVVTPHNRFEVTPAYLRGAERAQQCLPAMNPYAPGPSLAQYNYGYGNELAGYHDTVDLPFQDIAKDDPTTFFRRKR